MSVSLNLGSWGSVFAVPSAVVDEHLKLASPQQLKVLLFLLRNSGKSYSEKEIGDLLRIHEADVRDCVRFWVERKILSEFEGELTPVQDAPKTEEKPVNQEKAKPRTVVSRPQKPDIITAAQRVSADENLRHTLAEVESCLAKPLSGGDTATVVMLYDTLGLPPEVIIMLVNYCASIGKRNMRAIERIGIQWSDLGIDSVEAADNKIKQSKISSMNWNRVSSVFGLKNIGSPTAKQLSYVDVWIGEWHFSDEILRIAYEACVDNTGKMSLAYINKILMRWHNAGVSTPEDIEKLDKKSAPAKKPADKPSFDLDELEKIQ